MPRQKEYINELEVMVKSSKYYEDLDPEGAVNARKFFVDLGQIRSTRQKRKSRAKDQEGEST